MVSGHDHSFGQERKRPGERKTIIVIVLTAVTMVVEIVAGLVYGSMALLADGLHMASHAAALTISAAAYVYARRHASDRRYSFGTGKVNALAGFTGSVLLGLFAGFMAFESVGRIISPVDIVFDHALFVAVVGLAVNAISVVFLQGGHGHSKDEPNHDASDHDVHEDHNLRSAYFHVLADALTSVAAIVALLAGKYFGWVWLDPIMGIVGALLVGKWSLGLVRDTSAVLLDRQAPEPMVARVRSAIEPEARVVDLHIWSIGPGIYACVLAVEGPGDPASYAASIPEDLGIVHITVEVRARG
ncbi:MAG TPA: CDF family Co(II)/Ni(II) efflux transporter DmeF [Polyangiaceae bacterium]|jgi:cation diffusion facilitator family transporter|nr:MAG: Cadmium, cobalt and zinc/H(+)-K(+) antiporter [Deltaproteobacteria bacterium ADurb.Bin207]HNS98162.1 CDF family Co(II)/Ni(II) efflux transporter DmeF [Polyangiaceae bacterium]HNZ23854.1 CDF family Co(II)/Ni(II) efflux transporter DmeF [Polyangiaceae bacterium]HOD22353.1 CDF family Co(II)/Ni(II) efflux transporter DmeF [Polyangiaceae bacterium]HOE50254.1 CDF family Co(II)/Ni(II) efflux transporter DmeF [Polyangiaceae bacterium]